MKYIKELNSENETIFAVSKENFEKVNLADCYDRYGQTIGHYDAADYSLHNSACDAGSNCIMEIVEMFNLDENGEYEIYCDSNGWAFDNDQEISRETLMEIYDFIDNWERENAYYEEVLAYNYWNGHNWQSIIIEGDNYDDCCTHEVIEEDDLIKELDEAIENMEFYSKKFATTHYETEKYMISETKIATFFEYEINDIKSFESSVIRGEVEQY